MVPPVHRAAVLIVEDDGALRELYRSALKIAGYDVGAVEDGLDALRWVDAHVPNVIVLDLALPRVGGRDVQRELQSRAETRHIPIVVVTGGDAGDLNKADLACVLHKPVGPEMLVEVVDECVRGRHRILRT